MTQQTNHTKKQIEKQAPKHNEGMGHTIAGTIAIIVLAFSSVVVNAGGAAWGGNAGFDSLVTTLFFILFWSMFIVIYKNNKVLANLYYVLSLLLCMAATCGFVLRLTGNGGFISAALVSIAAVPFYGLTIFADWTVTYGIATAFTLWWMLYTGTNVRRLRNKKAAEQTAEKNKNEKKKSKSEK